MLIIILIHLNSCLIIRKKNIYVTFSSISPWPEITFNLCFLPFFKSIFIGIQLIYSVVLASVIQQCESVIHIYAYFHSFRFFSHIGHYGVLIKVPCAIQQVLISYLFYHFLIIILLFTIIYGLEVIIFFNLFILIGG